MEQDPRWSEAEELARVVAEPARDSIAARALARSLRQIHVFASLWIAMFAVMVIEHPPLSFLVLAAGVFWLGMHGMVPAIRKLRAMRDQPYHREAVVVRERLQEGEALDEHVAIVANRADVRRRLWVLGDPAQLAIGDVGVAITRGEALYEFVRIAAAPRDVAPPMGSAVSQVAGELPAAP